MGIVHIYLLIGRFLAAIVIIFGPIVKKTSAGILLLCEKLYIMEMNWNSALLFATLPLWGTIFTKTSRCSPGVRISASWSGRWTNKHTCVPGSHRHCATTWPDTKMSPVWWPHWLPWKSRLCFWLHFMVTFYCCDATDHHHTVCCLDVCQEMY